MLYSLCSVCGGDLPECRVCSTVGVMPVGLTMGQVDKLVELRAAFDRSGLDVSPCKVCGEPVICIPDGMPCCESCAKGLGD